MNIKAKTKLFTTPMLGQTNFIIWRRSRVLFYYVFVFKDKATRMYLGHSYIFSKYSSLDDCATSAVAVVINI